MPGAVLAAGADGKGLRSAPWLAIQLGGHFMSQELDPVTAEDHDLAAFLLGADLTDQSRSPWREFVRRLDDVAGTQNPGTRPDARLAPARRLDLLLPEYRNRVIHRKPHHFRMYTWEPRTERFRVHLIAHESEQEASRHLLEANHRLSRPLRTTPRTARY